MLDEADRMLDMGFIHDIKRIIKLLPQRRQNLLFSATYSDDIRGLAERLLADPLSIQVAPRNAPIELVEQRAYRVQKDHKRHLLAHLIREGSWAQVLIFTRTKHGANRLTQQLEGAGIQAAAIHGNKSQAARVRALDMFKRGEITALVATEVAARGLDIKELPHVVNYELPNVPEDYVHRIGRTGRGGLFRTCDLAGLGRRAGLAQGHRAAFEAQHPGGRDARIRDCGGAAAAADGAPARLLGSAQRRAARFAAAWRKPPFGRAAFARHAPAGCRASEPGHEVLQVGRELRAETPMLEAELHGRLQVAELVPAIVALPLELERIHRLALHEPRDAVGELDFPAGALADFREVLEQGPRQ